MLTGKLNNTESNHDAALGWIARFRSEAATDQDRQLFALWLAQDPSHKQAMDNMLDLWADLASVRQLYRDTPEFAPPSAANHSVWRKVSLAAAACFALALVVWPLGPDNADPLRYQTARGEQRTIELEDRSTITLNTDSRVSVFFDDEHRSIELLQGEAFFRVEKDPDRPFIVNTGNARVTAIGTAFNIYRQDQVSSITVVEGVVRVTELGATGNRAPASEILHANQRLQATSKGLQAATSADVNRDTAWQRGELIAQDMSLPALIRQIERYHDTRILITDSDVAAMTISGVFALNDLDPILQALQLSLGLEVVAVNTSTLLLLKPRQ